MRPATAKSSSVSSGGPDFPSSPSGGGGGVTPANLRHDLGRRVASGDEAVGVRISTQRADLRDLFLGVLRSARVRRPCSLHGLSTTHSRATLRSCVDLQVSPQITGFVSTV